VNRERARGRHEIECAAYALWRINWIHPFRGGNGRTSRMVAYLIICMALGHMLPGTPSIPFQIYEQRDEYLDSLRAVDASARALRESDDEAREVDVSAMVAFLQPMVERQIEAGVTAAEDA
jgi:Fic family protein